MFTVSQLLAHVIGDYSLQSDWMANEKTKKNVAALAHVLTYTIPFFFLTQSPIALLLIASSHFVIDRWRLARYVCWLKNFLAPPRTIDNERQVTTGGQVILVPKITGIWWRPWAECAGTGYHADRPPWMTVWLMIITDNTMHVLCNGLALYYFGG
jgi:hypothetical protein